MQYKTPATMPTSQRLCSRPKRMDEMINEGHVNFSIGTSSNLGLIMYRITKDRQKSSSNTGTTTDTPKSLNVIIRYRNKGLSMRKGLNPFDSDRIANPQSILIHRTKIIIPAIYKRCKLIVVSSDVITYIGT